MTDNFNQRKKDVLSKTDKSSIGKWDEKIISLCEKINSKENYYTTSSCSGRILLMIEQEKKGENLFLFVSHDKISFKELKNEIDKIVSPLAHPITLAPKSLAKLTGSKSGSANIFSQIKTVKMLTNSMQSSTIDSLKKEVITKASVSEQNKLINKNLKIKFKLEPAIIHIACKNLEDAEKLFEIGKNAGWKRLGIIGTRNGFTFELNSTEKLEFPIIKNKKILVDDNFLKIVVDDANKKLEMSWEKIRKLEKEI